MLSTPRFAAHWAPPSAAPVAKSPAPLLGGLCALLFFAPLFLGLGACQSGPTAADLGRTTDTAGEIVLFSDGTQMSLISESMLRVLGVPGKDADERTMNFYSQKRQSATAKVAPNDAVTGLIQYLGQSGFDDWATAGVFEGSAPSTIIVKINEDVRSMAQPTGAMADPAKLTQYVEFINAFMEVYNLIQGRQNVDGKVRFEKPVLSSKLRSEAEAGIGLGGSR